MYRSIIIIAVMFMASMAHSATLEIPGPGTTLSGIGVISGWKCEANGLLTVRFNNDDPIPLLYGSERTDVRNAGVCDDTAVGFMAIWNWGNLSDGEHTAVVYDNGVEFARSTFTVVTTGVSFLRDANGTCTIPDFPAPGENARFVWNQSTQHLELDEVSEKSQHNFVVGGQFKDCDTCPEMVVVPAGTFLMGNPEDQSQAGYEKPVHRVTIAQPFAVGVYEVTFAEWDACVADGSCNGYRPDDESWGRGQRPVINVNWVDAQIYVQWLSYRTGESYRLLSEAEWEYVARAGSTTRYWWGDELGQNRANCAICGSQWDDDRTAPVGSFAPNVFGLYDVSGNVWEWVQDCLNRNYMGAPSDGRAWESGECNIYRMMRGGSWDYYDFELRPSSRDWQEMGHRGRTIGFRVARSIP